MSNDTVAVIDCGTHTTKCGISGESLPRLISPNVIAVEDDGEVWVGSDALRKRRSCKLVRPMDRGRIVGWSDIEKVWTHTLEWDLGLNPKETTVLLTEAPDEPPRIRELKAEIMFENLGIPRFCLANQAVLSLYAEGRTSGVVVDIGAGSACGIAVSSGNMVGGYHSLPYTGDAITTSLLHEFSSLGFNPSSTTHRDIVNHIKDSHSFISTSMTPYVVDYTLPDRRKVSIKSGLVNLDKWMFTGDTSLTRCCEGLCGVVRSGSWTQ
eukprot:sb/3468290/